MESCQCVDLQTNINSYEEVICSIKDSGFDSCFVQLYNRYKGVIQQQIDLIKQIGLKIDFAHLDYQSINNLWYSGYNGDKEEEALIRDFEFCKQNGINMVLIHIINGQTYPAINDVGLSRINRLVDKAKSMGIKVTIENTRDISYIQKILEQNNSDNLGMCFDCGHRNIYDFGYDMSFAKDRIFCVHLHDNWGFHDDHLLPFDGDINWQQIIEILKFANFSGAMTLETHNEFYQNISTKELYKASKQRCDKLIEMFTK